MARHVILLMCQCVIMCVNTHAMPYYAMWIHITRYHTTDSARPWALDVGGCDIDLFHVCLDSDWNLGRWNDAETKSLICSCLLYNHSSLHKKIHSQIRFRPNILLRTPDMESGKAFLLQALALSRISSQKSYREAVRLEKVQFWRRHNF